MRGAFSEAVFALAITLSCVATAAGFVAVIVSLTREDSRVIEEYLTRCSLDQICKERMLKGLYTESVVKGLK